MRSGRLVVPVWLSTASGGNAHRPSVTATVYSDDQGRTWHAGNIAVPDTSETSIPNEASVVEPGDGHVLLNVRSESKAGLRILVESPDGASHWSKPVFNKGLFDPVCFGSMVRLPGTRTVLFAIPAERSRRNLLLRTTEDGGRTWQQRFSIDEGWSGYSDMTVARDGTTILCLYERGAADDRKFRAARLTLARFSLR